MITRTPIGLRAALVAAAALGWSLGASAQMTTAGTSINNRATVNYSVAGLAQAPIESSPTGNVTPGIGAGVDTAFVVDNMINLTVTEVSGNNTVVTNGTDASPYFDPEGFWSASFSGLPVTSGSTTYHVRAVGDQTTSPASPSFTVVDC